jgi:dolichol-phosphate mannosyltransferase
MSGFFMLKRSLFDSVVRRLSAQGYKILVDIFASSPTPLAFSELAFTFRKRLHGESKLDTLVAFEYVELIVDKLIGHIVPVLFVVFSAIGGLGLVVDLCRSGVLAQTPGARLPNEAPNRQHQTSQEKQDLVLWSHPSLCRLAFIDDHLSLVV